MGRYVLLSILVCCSPMFTSSALAAEFRGHVKGFYINSSQQALLTLKQDQTDNKPSCESGNLWDFQFNVASEHAKGWISMVLSAQATGKDIRIGYVASDSGYCNVNYVYFYD